MNIFNRLQPQITETVRRAAPLAMTFAFALLPHAASAQTITPPEVPPGLEVLGPDHAFRVGHARGTQNYECQPSASGPLGHVAWTLFTPEATLFGEQNEQLTTHFFSPNPQEGTGTTIRATWQDSVDTSVVWARGIAQATVDPTAITWVLLQAAGNAVGPNGGTTLAFTTFVQRLNTKGGLPPATGCDTLNDVGHKAFMPYTADYFFYQK